MVLAGVGGATSWLVASVLVGAWGAGTGITVIENVSEVPPGRGVPGPRGRQGAGVSMASLEHIFVTCHYTKKFWAEVIKWVGNLGIEIEPLSDKDIMFGIMSCKRDLFVNHILLIAKKYIYSCRCNKTKPSIVVLRA